MKTKALLALIILISGSLALRASPEMDRRIEDAAMASYNFHTVLQDQVKVTATDGVVTLTGTVEDKDLKELAGDTVKNLPGVTDVKNEITVKSTFPEYSDGWIAFKTRVLLLLRSHVSIADTDVSVKDGVVTLSGTAETPAQKELTEAYVKDVEGVKSVKNEITIKEKPPGPTVGEAISDTIDDASITAQVKYALLTHKSTSALKTDVTTNNGVVVITGEAKSDAEKTLVTKLAKDVRGVKSVTNNMTVMMAAN